MCALDQPVRKDNATYIVVNNVLSPEACDNVIALAKQIPAMEGQQGSNPEKRVCDIHWIPWSPAGGINLLYRKLADVIQQMNPKFWDFHLAGFLEPLQLTHYLGDKNGHYDWHADRGDQGIQMNRKISGTLLLSEDFQGGEFDLYDTPDIDKMHRGDLILFPSYHVHRVRPLTSGERWSLVFWVTGPSFV